MYKKVYVEITNNCNLKCDFCIIPVIIILPNSNFICSQILSFTGLNILVKKDGNLSYKKCRGKHKPNAIKTLIIFCFFKLKIITYN